MIRLLLRPHTVLLNHNVIEVWDGDTFLATVVGVDGPSVQVISRHGLRVTADPADINGLIVATVTILRRGDPND